MVAISLPSLHLHKQHKLKIASLDTRWKVPVTLFCLGICSARWLLLLLPGAFSKLRKATIRFVMSVCPRGTTRLPLDELSWNSYYRIFRKSVCKIQVWLKFDSNHRNFIRRPEFFFKWEKFQTKPVEKIRAQFYLFIFIIFVQQLRIACYQLSVPYNIPTFRCLT